MIRYLTGMGLVFGSVGGMELSTLSPMAASILGVIGLMLAYSPVRDGSLKRLIIEKTK